MDGHPQVSDAFALGSSGLSRINATDPRTAGQKMRVWAWRKALIAKGYEADEINQMTKDQCIAIWEGDIQRSGIKKPLASQDQTIEQMDRVSMMAGLGTYGVIPPSGLDDAGLRELYRTKLIEMDIGTAPPPPKSQKTFREMAWPVLRQYAKSIGIVAPQGTRRPQMEALVESKLNGPNAPPVR